MDNTILAALIGVVGGVGGALAGAYIGGVLSRRAALDAAESSNKNALAIMRHQEFFAASSRFKATVLYELVGFYPINQYWEQDQFPRIRDSIPRIITAAADFRYFVARKTDFDNAVSDYCKYCRETTFNSIDADILYPNNRKEGELGKRNQFKKFVEHLISFTQDG